MCAARCATICNMKYKPIPFSLDRNSRVSLTRQVEAGFKRAILAGRYAAGDVLPPREELASMLGVSSIVTREAVRRLVEQGFIIARPRIGSVVCKPDSPRWKGRVVLVGANGDGVYYIASLGQTLRARLVAAGYLTTDTTVVWKDQGVCDISCIAPFLYEAPDMAVVLTPGPPILDLIAGEGVPFVALETKPGRAFSQCLAWFKDDMETAARQLVAFCRDEGVKKVLEVWAWNGNARIRDDFRRAGITIVPWKIKVPPQNYSFIDAVQRCAMEAFERRLSREGKSWLPDLIYFSDDDHVASGALSALLHHGVDVPGAVRVATLSNRGLGPVFHRPLTRLELDPIEHGNVIADYVLARLAGKTPQTVPKLPVTFFPGETLGTGETSLASS